LRYRRGQLGAAHYREGRRELIGGRQTEAERVKARDWRAIRDVEEQVIIVGILVVLVVSFVDGSIENVA
jgi:hypothetical protein